MIMSEKTKTGTRSPLSRRLEGVSESATLKLNATVQMMKEQKIDVVNFTAGEPDFAVPEVAKEAIKESLALNRSKYTPVPGVPELRKAIAQKINQQQPGVAAVKPWDPANVVVTNGGKQALFNAFMAILDPGDEVLIPTPYWLSYPEMVKIAGGIPKFITAPYSQGFKIKPEQLKNSLGPKVKALILNSPSNPTGVMYTRKEFAEIADVLLRTPGADDIWILSDEIYDRIILGDTPFCSFLESSPDLRSRTITINGMSKSAAMTGWRVGWSVAEQNVTQAMITLQGQSTSGINALAQWASVAALKLPESHFTAMVSSFRKRRNLVLENLTKAPRIDVIAPDGAFYIFIGIRKYLRAGEDSVGFAQRLLEDAKVAVVPGTPFGEPEFIRISFATDEATLRTGCERLIQYLS